MKLKEKLEVIALSIMAIFGVACMLIAFPYLEWKFTFEQVNFWEDTFFTGFLITIGSSFSIIMIHKEAKPSA